MAVAANKHIEKFTYADYVAWDDKERWELIFGEPYNMTPAPATAHQLISMELAFQIKNQLKGKQCKVVPAPFDVRLPIKNEKEEDIENIVQPDISIICDPKKLDKKGCLGAPDMIIEITSPSTTRKDRKEKFYLYELVGVKEYWLVFPDDKIVEVFRLGADGKYGRPDIYSDTDSVRLQALKSLSIDLSTVFETEPVDSDSEVKTETKKPTP